MSDDQLKGDFQTAFYGMLQAGKIENIVGFYHENAQFTSEGNNFRGNRLIAEKHVEIFSDTRFSFTSTECQRISAEMVIIIVLGQLMASGSDKPLAFTHTFVLAGNPQGMQITNEIFMINVHNF